MSLPPLLLTDQLNVSEPDSVTGATVTEGSPGTVGLGATFSIAALPVSPISKCPVAVKEMKRGLRRKLAVADPDWDIPAVPFPTTGNGDDAKLDGLSAKNSITMLPGVKTT